MKQYINEPIIHLDTADKLTRIRLYNHAGQTIDKMEWPARFNQSEELLQRIDDLLKKNQVAKADLSGILVNRGPGSFTGLRVGITTANFLAYSLNVPVVELKKEEKITNGLKKIAIQKGYNKSAEVFYDCKPRITSKK